MQGSGERGQERNGVSISLHVEVGNAPQILSDTPMKGRPDGARVLEDVSPTCHSSETGQGGVLG